MSYFFWGFFGSPFGRIAYSLACGVKIVVCGVFERHFGESVYSLTCGVKILEGYVQVVPAESDL